MKWENNPQNLVIEVFLLSVFYLKTCPIHYADVYCFMYMMPFFIAYIVLLLLLFYTCIKILISDELVSANSLCTGIIFLHTEFIFMANKSNLRFKWYFRNAVTKNLWFSIVN
jgi:hypothetical protein